MDDEVMTIQQVADYLKIKKRTAYKLVKEGKIPGTRVGRQWRFKKEIIDKIFAHDLGNTSKQAIE